MKCPFQDTGYAAISIPALSCRAVMNRPVGTKRDIEDDYPGDTPQHPPALCMSNEGARSG
jgi:hypothetical protein